jgi:hypothetical protein
MGQNSEGRVEERGEKRGLGKPVSKENYIIVLKDNIEQTVYGQCESIKLRFYEI